LARDEGSNAFFLEKKKQKTFDWFSCGPAGQSATKFVKVFWFFFSKKNMLPSWPT
jgi:hypothetical protein